MKNKYSLELIRHSLAHIMALAIKRMYPKAKFGVGPAIENGFYYDVEVKKGGKGIIKDDLSQIEKEMKEIIKEGLPFKKKRITLAEASKLFKKLGQPYKLELLRDLKKYGTTIQKDQSSSRSKKPKTVTIFQVGDFIDLCRGPHVANTKDLPLSFKLVKIAGAYWRGKESNPMLQRIQGIAFPTDKDLKNYLHQQAEAEKRDHRVLGKTLKLFSINDDIGPGLILWLPRGAILKKIVEDYVLNEYLKNGYQLVLTPHIAQLKLWDISGHTGFYRDNMFPPMHLREINKEEKDDYQLKPMNCPFHILIYKNEMKSYRDLPVRYTELGTVYRYERSGTLHGLTRVRGFTQDDAHIWCTPDQLDQELKNLLKFALRILRDFGFKEYDVYISTRPEKYVGTLTNWKKATRALKNALKEAKVDYQIDKGGGVFYGPKIDIKIKDSLGRPWQCTTIQVDFNLPERFDMFYINEKGKKQRPVMIHRALLGSIERFLGVLIESYGGKFPVWLSPVQVVILPVKEDNEKYATKVREQLDKENVRCELWGSKETLSKRIREAELQKIPYVVVVGKKEEKAKKIAVRERGKGDLGEKTITFLIKQIKNKIKHKN